MSKVKDVEIPEIKVPEGKVYAYAGVEEPYLSDDVMDEIRPCRPKRDWMDRTDFKFANKCAPLTAANSIGWEILNPHHVQMNWEGYKDQKSLFIIRYDTKSHSPSSHFGSGIVTWHIPFLFQTPPGYGIYVMGPANNPKEGIIPLEGFVETDWLPYTFTMNWMITEPNKIIEFDKGEPICRIFVLPKELNNNIEIEVRNLDENADWKMRYSQWKAERERWNKARDEFEDSVEKGMGWRADYNKGQEPSGEKGDHLVYKSKKPKDMR